MNNNIKFNCIYCGCESTETNPLIQVRTAGTYYQHWNFENQKGCKENKNNISPNGETITTK